MKTPEQVLRELDAMLKVENPGAVYFVNDNFVGDRRAAMNLLPHLIDWQKQNGYPVQSACEATLNLAQNPKLLEMMREAYFCTVFCGIETPEPQALKSISKDQNLSMPIVEAVKTLNRYGMEVVSGIILGLDTDTPETGDRILEFIQSSQIPMLTINLLYALPKTPLWRRLEAEGRLILKEGRESNVAFLMPCDQIEMWRRCVTEAYHPKVLFERFAHQCEHTYPNRIQVPNSPARVTRKYSQGPDLHFSAVFWTEGTHSQFSVFFEQCSISAIVSPVPPDPHQTAALSRQLCDSRSGVV